MIIWFWFSLVVGVYAILFHRRTFHEGHLMALMIVGLAFCGIVRWLLTFFSL